MLKSATASASGCVRFRFCSNATGIVPAVTDYSQHQENPPDEPCNNSRTLASIIP